MRLEFAAPTGPKPLDRRLSESIAPPLVVALLIGGLLVPGGERTLVYPISVLCALMIVTVIAARLPRLHWIVVFIVCLFGSLGLSALLNVPPASDYGIEKFRYLMTLTLLSAAASCLITDERSLTHLARVWVVAAVYLATMAIPVAGMTDRATPFGNNPIWVGRVFSTGLIMLIWLWLSHRVRLRWVVPSAAVLLAGLAATGSRGPLIALAVGIAILSVFGGSGRRRLVVAAGTIMAATIAIQLPLFQESRITRIASAGLLTDFVRPRMIAATIDIVREHPFGVGIGSWANHSLIQSVYQYPHNLFLEVAAEFGAILGVLLVAFVIAVLAKLIRRSRSSTTMLLLSAWLTAEIVHVSVSGDLNARTFFFVLGLSFLTLLRRDARENQLEEPDSAPV